MPKNIPFEWYLLLAFFFYLGFYFFFLAGGKLLTLIRSFFAVKDGIGIQSMVFFVLMVISPFYCWHYFDKYNREGEKNK